MATSFSGGGSRRTTDHGLATGKLYHLRVECTLFCNLQSRVWTHAIIQLHFHSLFFKIRGPGGSMNYVVGLPNNSYKTITNTVWVRTRLCELQKGCTRLAAASDKAYQLLAHGRWLSPGSLARTNISTTRATTDVIASFISDMFVLLFCFHSFIHCHDNL
jgi:hypothetical protein